MKNYSLKDKIDKGNYNDFQYDFIYLTELLEIGYPNIDHEFPKKERIIMKDSIVRLLAGDKILPSSFVLQSRKYLSKFHNQHTNLYLDSDVGLMYPFEVHISNDQWILLTVDRNQDSLLIGREILSINDLKISEIEKRLVKFTFGENKINQQYELRNWGFYKKANYLKEIGVIMELTDRIKLTFADSTTIDLKPNILSKHDYYAVDIPENKTTKIRPTTYAFDSYVAKEFGYLQFNNCHDKIDILDGIENYVKPWIQPLARTYVKSQFKKDNPSKRIASYYNSEYPVFKDFVWEMVDSLNNNGVKNLIIDLRNNPGGNLMLGIQLMYFLTEERNLKGFSEYIYSSEIYKNYFPDAYDQAEQIYGENLPANQLIPFEQNETLFANLLNPDSKYHVMEQRPIFDGKVYVLANYRTGSAAAMLTTLLQDNNLATVIGTSVGNNPTGATTYTPIKLPKTKASVSIATSYQERPNKIKGEVQIPDFWIEYSVSNLMNGIDPYLEKAIELIMNSKN